MDFDDLHSVVFVLQAGLIRSRGSVVCTEGRVDGGGARRRGGCPIIGCAGGPSNLESQTVLLASVTSAAAVTPQLHVRAPTANTHESSVMRPGETGCDLTGSGHGHRNVGIANKQVHACVFTRAKQRSLHVVRGEVGAVDCCVRWRKVTAQLRIDGHSHGCGGCCGLSNEAVLLAAMASQAAVAAEFRVRAPADKVVTKCYDRSVRRPTTATSHIHVVEQVVFTGLVGPRGRKVTTESWVDGDGGGRGVDLVLKAVLLAVMAGRAAIATNFVGRAPETNAWRSNRMRTILSAKPISLHNVQLHI